MKKQLEPARKPTSPDEPVIIEPEHPRVKNRVTLRAPKQRDNKTVYYNVGEPVDPNALPDPGGFKPCRFVINIVVDKESIDVMDPLSQPDAETDSLAPDLFDPPVELAIEITDEDIQYAAPQKIGLAYHNGRKWVVVREKNIDKAGVYSFKIRRQGDPAIAKAP